MLENIRRCYQEDRVLFSQHAKEEMENEEFGPIFEHEIQEALLYGKILERYTEDKPFPSCLIFGLTKTAGLFI